MSIKQQNLPHHSLCGYLLPLNTVLCHFYTSWTNWNIKPALAEAFEFLIAKMPPVMAHCFSSYTGFYFGSLQMKAQNLMSFLIARNLCQTTAKIPSEYEHCDFIRHTVLANGCSAYKQSTIDSNILVFNKKRLYALFIRNLFRHPDPTSCQSPKHITRTTCCTYAVITSWGWAINTPETCRAWLTKLIKDK
jgi:hypothetical protein